MVDAAALAAARDPVGLKALAVALEWLGPLMAEAVPLGIPFALSPRLLAVMGSEQSIETGSSESTASPRFRSLWTSATAILKPIAGPKLLSPNGV